VAAKKFLVPVDFTQQELQNAVIQQLGSDPGSPVNGQTWVNTTGNVLKVRINGVSIQLGRLDQISAPTAAVAMNGQKITGMADPTAGTDAATKQYVDAAIAGMDWHQSVRAATTAAGTLASSFANGSVIDGVTLATGDRILIKNQSTGSENGIYIVAASGAPSRATDADTGAEFNGGASIPVEEGTTNADTVWILTNNGTPTIGTTALTFSKLGPLSGAATKYTQLIGNGSSTSIAVTHNLGTTGVIAQVYDASTLAQVECDIVATDTNTTTFIFTTAPASNAYRVVIVG